MTPILVLLVFIAFILYDLFLRNQASEHIPAVLRRADPERRALRPVVAGYEIPEHLYFHLGHSWALTESPFMVRVGIDDFAAKLIGEAQAVTLPQRGQWIRQGQNVFSFRVNDQLVHMVSPIEGTVNDVNDELMRHPNTLTAEPYGAGWLLTVNSPDCATNLRNLLTSKMARGLMLDNAKKLATYLGDCHLTTALAQDGGTAHGEIAKLLPQDKYVEITKEFFLT